MNSFYIFVCVLVYLLHTEAAHMVKLPKGFIYCKQNDPNFQACVQKAATASVPELARGVPRFALPTIDPLRISTLSIDQGHGPVSIRLNFTDLDIYGLKTAIISKANVDIEKLKLKVELDLPKSPLILNGVYSILGKVLILPISGNGHCRLTLNGFKANTESSFVLAEKNGEKYWSLSNLDLDFSVSKLHVILENLFNGDKALGNNMNLFLNENWSEILEELRPAFRVAFSSAFAEIVQRFFDRVPIAQVFPKQ